MKFEFLEHTADIKFRAYGKTLNEAFEGAVDAVSYFLARGEKIAPKKGRVINVSADDIESLLYKFLEETIFLLDAENFITAKARVIIRGNNLRAELYGDDVSNYSDLDYIKAVTYSEMYVK